MKITKAKLVKGTFLKVSFSDGNAEIEKTYPHTEAPPRLLKAFFALNSHLCNLTEQYDSQGVPDFDNIACRGYSTKGDDEKEGIVLTGVRSLSSGKVIVLNSPFSTLDITDSEYPLIKVLVEELDRCRDEIESFMDNNKSQDEIQGRLFNTPDENFILKSTPGEKTGTELTADALNGKEVDVTHLYTKKEQDKMDEEMPLTQEMIQANNARNKKRGPKAK